MLKRMELWVVVFSVVMVSAIASGAMATAVPDFNAGQSSCQLQYVFTQYTNEYAWTVQNISDRSLPLYDLLSDSVIPYNIFKPTSTIAPAGFLWNGSVFGVSPSAKYYVSPSIGPGQTRNFFAYFNPADPTKINVDSHAPTDGSGLLCHSLVVVPSSGNFTGTDKWDSCDAEFGGDRCSNWYDKPCLVKPVPDASTFVLAFSGVAMFGAGILRRRVSC